MISGDDSQQLVREERLDNQPRILHRCAHDPQINSVAQDHLHYCLGLTHLQRDLDIGVSGLEPAQDLRHDVDTD